MEKLWNPTLLSFFPPKPVLVMIMTICFFELGAGPWRLTLWKSFLLDPVARRDRDPNGRELPTCKYSNRRTILVVWFLFFLDDHQSMLLNRVSNLTRPGVPPPVDVFPERIGQIWGISSESAKFKPSRASQSPKYHWRLHRSVLARDRGAPPPATSYCFFKFNRGKYGTPCKNWKVNRIHVNVLFIRHMFYAFPNQICTYCGRRSKKLWPNIWTQSRQSCSGNRGANSLWVKPNGLKKQNN